MKRCFRKSYRGPPPPQLMRVVLKYAKGGGRGAKIENMFRIRNSGIFWCPALFKFLLINFITKQAPKHDSLLVIVSVSRINPQPPWPGSLESLDAQASRLPLNPRPLQPPSQTPAQIFQDPPKPQNCLARWGRGQDYGVRSLQALFEDDFLFLLLCTHTHTHPRMHAGIGSLRHAQACSRAQARTGTRRHARRHARTRTHTHTHTHTTHTHTHTHNTHTHTQHTHTHNTHTHTTHTHTTHTHTQHTHTHTHNTHTHNTHTHTTHTHTHNTHTHTHTTHTQHTHTHTTHTHNTHTHTT